ncbi:MAG: hypothetical protein ACTS2F_27925 [Thainema sp.]
MSKHWEILQAHYLQASRVTQLDNLALSLAQIQLSAQSGTDESAIQHLIQESQSFVEWVVDSLDLEADIVFATELTDLQALLSQWALSWSELWPDENEREEIAVLAQQWCDRIHEQSELLMR